MMMLCALVLLFVSLIFFFKPKTAYEMRISDWSSDVCSSDLIRWIAIAAALPLAACSSSEAPPESAPPPPEAEMTCQADAVQSYVGQAVTPDLGAAILKASGARTLRWGPPRSAMTMDYRVDRVNVMYDDASKIDRKSTRLNSSH